MKKVHKKRNTKFNKRLMEAWGYSRNHLGSFKRDDERPLEAALAEEELEESNPEQSAKEAGADFLKGLKSGHKNPNKEAWGGNKGDENQSAVHGEKSLRGAEDYEPVFEEEDRLQDADQESRKKEIEELASEAVAAIQKLGAAAGATIDAGADAGGPAQMSDIAEMIHQEIKKMLLKGDK